MYSESYHAIDTCPTDWRHNRLDMANRRKLRDWIQATQEGPGEVVGTTSCPRLPPMTFDYQHVLSFDTKGNSARRDLPGYEGFDERIHTMTNSPDYSVDEEQTDLFDINSDALPDVLVTAPGFFGNKHGVFFNGALGTPDSFGRDTIEVAGVLGATSNDITLKNLNLSPQDVDGDGTIDLLHKIGRAHVRTPVTWPSRMPAS